MFLGAIWDKSAHVNVSKTDQMAQARGTSVICCPIKNLRLLIYPTLHKK